MPVSIKTPEEIEKMRVAGRMAAEVLEMIAPHVQAGISTAELDELCHQHIVNVQKATPAPLNYRGFPRSICTSLNHQVCHGIPGDRRLKDGDILNIDITVIHDGYHGDTSRMFIIGKPSVKAQRVVDIAHEALWRGIRMVRPGARLGDIGHAVQTYAEAERCSVVREYCGHGIGREFHEDPQVLHFGTPGEGMELQPGMTFTIEPMVNIGKRHTRLLADGWTVVTKDHSLSAQW
ncbi:MAG: type I methionyl aminopeptidase, partial [Chromatiaceae bacterium]